MTFSTTNNWYIPDTIDLVEEEDMPDFSDNIPKDLKDFRKKLELVQDIEGTGVIFLAVSKNDDLNDIKAISALCGDPINVGVYDMVKDYYYARCHSFIDIGAIPVNYKLCIKGVHDWSIDVPVPLPVIERYLSEHQQNIFDDWRNSLGNVKDFLIETIQAIYVY